MASLRTCSQHGFDFSGFCFSQGHELIIDCLKSSSKEAEPERNSVYHDLLIKKSLSGKSPEGRKTKKGTEPNRDVVSGEVETWPDPQEESSGARTTLQNCPSSETRRQLLQPRVSQLLAVLSW